MIRHLCLTFLFCAHLAAIAVSTPVQEEESDVEWGPWSVILPFDYPTGGGNVTKELAPERELKSMRLDGPGPDFERKWDGKAGHDIQWQPARTDVVAAPDMGSVDFLTLVPDVYTDKSNNLTKFSAAYAHRTFRSPRNQEIAVSFGSDDGARIWLNGKLIHDKGVLRGLNVDDDPLVLDLKAGLNHLFVKVCNEGGGWGMALAGPKAAEPEAPDTPISTIDKAIDRGAVYLLKTQNLDGSWSFEGHGYRNGQTSLSVYALLKSGLTEDHPAIQRALQFLRLHPPVKTYSASVQLLALISTKNPEHYDWIEDIAEELIDWQEGGFGYPSGQNDLSNTQYGALGLWAAQTVGVKIPSRVWLYLLRNALSHQNDDGGFGYRIGNVSNGSMTVAGLTVVAICIQGYGDSGVPSQLEKKTEQSLEAGLKWLGNHFSSTENPEGGARWRHYYLYGIERLAALLGTERIGEYDWYRQGAHQYVKEQGADGQWGTAYGEGELNTAFGLIFLSRGTASLTGKKSSTHANRLYATDGDEAEIVLRASGDTPLNLWLSEIRPAAAEKYSRDGKGGNGLYIAKAEYLADGEVVATVENDATKPWKSATLATQYAFTSRGEHEVQLRLHLAPDPEAAGAKAPQVIESPKLTIRIDKLMEAWMLDYPDDAAGNLVLEQRREASASSQRGDGAKADLAFDGLMGTAWISAKNDSEPTLTLQLKRSVRVDRIVLSHAASKELWRGHFDRATKVSVGLGSKREPLIYELDPDEEHKNVLVLPRTSKVTELIIRVLEREPGSKHPGHVGFAEVELRMGDK